MTRIGPTVGGLLARWGAGPRAARGPGAALRTLWAHGLARCEGRRLLGRDRNGEPVWSRLGDDHLLAHPDARVLLPRALLCLAVPDAPGAEGAALVEFGRPIGWRTCVPTSSADDVVYARRIGRTTGCTRFVRGGRPLPCSTLRVVLRRTEAGLAEVRTAYVGLWTPPEPSAGAARASEESLARSLAFWSRHALVWDGRIDVAYGIHRTPPPRDWAGVGADACGDRDGLRGSPGPAA